MILNGPTKAWLRLPEVGCLLSIEAETEGEGRGVARLGWDPGRRHVNDTDKFRTVILPTYPGVTHLNAHTDDLCLVDREAWFVDGDEDDLAADAWHLTDHKAIDRVSTIEVSWPNPDACRWVGVRYAVYARTVVPRLGPRPLPRDQRADELMLSTCYDLPGVWVNYELVFCASAREHIEGARMQKKQKRTKPLIHDAFGLDAQDLWDQTEGEIAEVYQPPPIPIHEGQVKPAAEMPPVPEKKKRWWQR